MEKESRRERDWVLITIIFFFGWFGIDKIYAKKSFRTSWKLMFVKLIFNIGLLGIFWNIYDLVRALLGTYEVDFRDYFA